MEYNMSLRQSIFRSVLQGIPKNDIREYLNGAYFDPKGYVVGTDGHLVVIADVSPSNIPEAWKGKIMARASVEAIGKAKLSGGRRASDDLVEADNLAKFGIAPVFLDMSYPLQWFRAIQQYVPFDGYVNLDPALTQRASAALLGDGNYPAEFVPLRTPSGLLASAGLRNGILAFIASRRSDWIAESKTVSGFMDRIADNLGIQHCRENAKAGAR
jgi:hypothetical protein